MYFWTEDQKQFLRDNYKTLTGREIGLALGKSKNTVHGRALAMGLKKGHKTHYHNENFFTVPNLSNCYWAGMIAADGCLRNIYGKCYSLCLLLKLSDEEHVANFSKDIEYNGTLKYRDNHLNSKTFKTVAVEICSAKKINQDLEINFNVTPKKSLTLRPPNLHDINHKLAFIKGYWDGDGSITVNKKGVFVVSCLGTKEMLSWIKEVFDELIPVKKCSKLFKKNIHNSKNTFVYYIYGRRAKTIFDKLHSIKTPELKRKWKWL